MHNLEVGNFFSFNRSLSRTNAHDSLRTNGEDRSIYKDNGAFLPSFYTCPFSSTHVPLSLPQISVLTKETKIIRTSALHILRASDSFVPYCFRRYIDPKRISEGFVRTIKRWALRAICWACRAAPKTSNKSSGYGNAYVAHMCVFLQQEKII